MGKDFQEHIQNLIGEIFDDFFALSIPEDKDSDQWDYDSLQKEILSQFGVDIRQVIREDYRDLPYLELKETIFTHLQSVYAEKEKLIGAQQLRELERLIMLQIIDMQWKDHLLNNDHLKEGIGLRGYAQKDPLIEYKKESYQIFEEMRDRVDEEVIRFLYLFRPVAEEEMEELKERKTAKLAAPTFKMPGKKHKKRR